MSNLLDLISEFIQITGNSTIDNIILTVIGLISCSVAFGIVGMIFDALGFYDSDIMSDVHWGIRIIIFIALCAVGIGIAKFIKWLFSFQWWVYLIVGILVIGIIILVYYLKYKHSKKKAKVIKTEVLKAEVVDEKIEEVHESQEIVTIDRDHCPRCGALLVKRHGPFGDFYGCKNFSTQNCRYTRKFK